MLTQLKKIKKALISEGKLVKYLSYIVGEILLVAIGILIALQVDNWDKDQDNRKFERQYYQSMKTELLEDKKELIGQIEYGKRYKKQYNKAIDIINRHDRKKVNELGFIATELKNFSDFRRKSSIYQTLVNSGEIKHVQNHSIIGALQDLESEYLYIERLEDVHRQAAMDNLSTWVISAIQWQPFKVHKPELLYGHIVNNTFVLIVGLIDEKNQVYQNAIDIIDKIIEMLDK
ncbi:hypothetical protein ESZ36_20355 [Colwellia demingiae]|uniref:Uncharacterized protein n=1 Tax=Colwellia demingiae TaxID=89401 RepID=A0A5C6Q658_9GAMM|nr:DUF6090 family protein [Colwellia demingiae]TWX64329.1 hypothetical protein ESZ36_20355 [Colwellia demingiae]